MEFVSVVIPVYNEEEAIGGDLDLIKKTMDAAGLAYEIIVVNDGSTDRSVEIVSSRPYVKLVHHERNRGNGAARTTGMKAAKGDIIIMTDGDGTYPNQDMPKLLEYMNQYDMVIGARVKEMGTVKWLRTPAKWFIRRLASYLTETEIPDLNSGLRAFRKDLAFKYLHILPNTHSWVSTITIAFLSDGYSVKFVPIDYYKRKGESKFHPLQGHLQLPDPGGALGNVFQPAEGILAGDPCSGAGGCAEAGTGYLLLSQFLRPRGHADDGPDGDPGGRDRFTGGSDRQAGSMKR